MHRTVTTHSTVTATVEDVWMTLTDLTGYARWNPFIIAATGDVQVGERLVLITLPPGGRAVVFTPWVTAVEPPRYLEWLGRAVVPGVFDRRHSFTLTPMPGGRTLLQQSETCTGVLVPFAQGILDRTRAGFVAMNEALTDGARALTDTSTEPAAPTEPAEGRQVLRSAQRTLRS